MLREVFVHAFILGFSALALLGHVFLIAALLSGRRRRRSKDELPRPRASASDVRRSGVAAAK